jgi:hypothetical protein
MAQLLEPGIAIAVVIGVAWLGVSAIVLSVCRIAAKSDEEIVSEIRNFAVDDPCLRSTSQAPAPEDVSHCTQQDLDVAPKRPVGHVQIVDRSHFA